MKRLFALTGCLLLLLALTLSAQARVLPYGDHEQIRNLDAVTMLTDLGLMEGDEHELFRPNDSMTRAEIAKLAALILSPEPMAEDDAPFPDVAGSWAEDYISYCYEHGFLDGYEDGSFCPDAPITARELTKMLLGAVGYDQSAAVGSGWDETVDALARELQVYNGYEYDLSRPISRDYAALLILNILNCTAVTGYENGEPVPLLDDLLNPVTVLEARFGVQRYQEVITANELLDLEHPGEALEDGRTKLRGHFPMPFSTGIDALGRTVTVYLRDGQVVGAPVFDPEEFCVTVTGQESLDLLFQSGGYLPADDAQIFENGLPADGEALQSLTGDDTVTLIDYESDSRIDLLLILRWGRSEVLQADPLVIITPDGTSYFPDKRAEEDTVRTLCFHGHWILCPY